MTDPKTLPREERLRLMVECLADGLADLAADYDRPLTGEECRTFARQRLTDTWTQYGDPGPLPERDWDE